MAYGGILGQTSSGGKKVCRLVVGTSTSGWTANDCDYLCDGTADDVEINAAIQALPDTGGEIVILDGTYNITGSINMNKANVKLSGNGAATVLRRMWTSSSSTQALISITANGCCVESLYIDGNKGTYPSQYNRGIYITSDNNKIVGNISNNNGREGIFASDGYDIIQSNICIDNNDAGIYLNNNNYCSVLGNICNSNANGIVAYSGHSVIVGNELCANSNYGIQLRSGNYNTVTGNTSYNNLYGLYLSGGSSGNVVAGNSFMRGTGTSEDYNSSQKTISCGRNCNNNLFVGNNIMGKNYTDSGSGNTWADNKYS